MIKEKPRFVADRPFYNQILEQKHLFNLSVENLFVGFYKNQQLIQIFHYKGERFCVNGSYHEDIPHFCYKNKIDTLEICHNHPDYYATWPSAGDMHFTLDLMYSLGKCKLADHFIFNRSDEVCSFLERGLLTELGRLRTKGVASSYVGQIVQNVWDNLLDQHPLGIDHWAYITRDRILINSGQAPKEWITSRLGRVQRKRNLMKKS